MSECEWGTGVPNLVLRPSGLRRRGEVARAAMRDRTHELRQVRSGGCRVGAGRTGRGLAGIQDSGSSGRDGWLRARKERPGSL